MKSLRETPNAEYIFVTDDPKLESKTWNVIYDKSLDGLSTFDKCYAIRFNIFKYATADICIYLDANIQVNKPLSVLIDKMDNGHNMTWP